MKILYTGFKDKNNASCQLVELINANEKVDIRDKKVDIGNEKVDIETLKLVYR